MAVEWYTPSEIIDAARRTMGGIDLDPASDEEAQETVKAARYYTVRDDGLLQPWSGRVWLNPPFGAQDTRRFVGRLIDCYDRGEVEQGCLLLLVTPNSRSATTCLGRFPCCVPHGRNGHGITFRRPRPLPPGRVQFPVLVAYLGPHADAFAREFSAHGAVCCPMGHYRSETGALRFD